MRHCHLQVVAVVALSFLALATAPSAQAQVAQFTNVNYVNAPAGPDLTVPLLREGNIKMGVFNIHPHFGIAESVTDNVFRQTQPFGTRQRDAITTYAPGLQAQLPVGRHMLVVNYMANIDRYSRFHQDNVEDQDRSAQLLLDFPGGLTVKGLAQLKDGHDPRGSQAATAGIGSEPNKWYTSTYGGEFQLASQAFARLRLKSTRWEFIGVNAGARDGSAVGDINTRNRLENYGALAFGAGVAPKTYAFVEGSAAQAIYEINKPLDSATYIADIGARWEATGKTTGELKVGWLEKIFDHAITGTRGSEKLSTFHVDGNIVWLVQDRTQVTLALFRRPIETVVPGTTFALSTGTNLNVTHAFTEKWRGTALFGYDRTSYSDPTSDVTGKFEKREDNYTTFGGGVWYQIQPWLGVRATYTYTERLSNFDSVQYNANVGMLSVQAQF